MTDSRPTVDSIKICDLTQPFINQIMDARRAYLGSPTSENLLKYEEQCDLLSTQVALILTTGTTSSAVYNIIGEPDPEDSPEEAKLKKIWFDTLIRNLKHFNLNNVVEWMQDVLKI